MDKNISIHSQFLNQAIFGSIFFFSKGDFNNDLRILSNLFSGERNVTELLSVRENWFD